MFESSFALEGPARRSPLFISLTVQAAAVAVALLIPLYYVEQLTVLPSMPVPVYAPKLPHIKIMSVIREAATSLAPRLTAPSLRRPLQAPSSSFAVVRGAVVISEAGMPAIEGPAMAVAGPFLTGMSFNAVPPAPPPLEKPVAAASAGRVRVGGDVQSARLIHQIRPVYPPLAKQARIQGTVRLQAVIARDGRIQNLQLTSGHPLLVPAAMEAVRQWRYRPTTLNGENVEVLTQINVNFALQ